MDKKCKSILLTSSNESKIRLDNKERLSFEPYIKGLYYNGLTHTYQHLYILSDDEIKKDNWYFLIPEQQIKQAKNDLPKFHEWKKIIATTDSSLKIQTSVDCGSSVGNVIHNIKLPSPSQSFIQKFVEEYNKGNMITEVMVEYVDNGYEVDMEGIGGSDIGWFEKLEPKINPKDSTVTIRRIKDSWTREEVIKLLRSQFELLKEIQICGKDLNTFLFKNWINNNL